MQNKTRMRFPFTSKANIPKIVNTNARVAKDLEEIAYIQDEI